MFGKVWKWAGQYRKTGKSIGVDAYMIQIALKELVDDTIYWTEHRTYEPDEIAARLHHRLVYIHPYPNGNGRHARKAAFTWGSENLTDPGRTRSEYIAALRAADEHDYGKLFRFVRS